MALENTPGRYLVLSREYGVVDFRYVRVGRGYNKRDNQNCWEI